MNILRRLHAERAATWFGCVVAAALVLVAGFATTQRASATNPTCSSVGFTLSPLHGTRFYVDHTSTPVLDSGYTGVSISPNAAKTNVWVKLSGFAGGALGLSTNQPSAFPLGNLASGSTTPAYFFLTASPVGDNATAQTFSVDVYQGDPSHGGSLLCSYADGYSAGIYDTIQASANKLQDVTGDSISSAVSTSSPVIGGTITLTVEGTTGTLGNGPDGTPFIYETPTSLGSWPAGSFRLTGTTLTLSPGASQTVYTDQLQIANSTFSAAQNYIAQYTFQITGTTAAATTPYPIQEISSGTQVKHTNTSSLASIPAIQPASNTMTLSQTASTASLPSSGGTVTYTVKLHSTSSSSTAVDELVDTLPASTTYVAGTAKLDGSAIADPTVSSGTLVFPGPFALSSAADRTITYDVTLPASAGTYTNSVIGYVASTQIDTTTSTSDSAPATASTTVAGAPQTITFTQPADTRVDQGPVALSATASSGLAVSFAGSTASVCTVSGSSVTLIAAGTCTITASQPGNATYSAATPVSQSFQVTAAPQSQTITFAQPAGTRVDQGPVLLSATASSGLTVSFASSTTSVCTVSGSSVTLITAGTCAITASQSGNATFAAAASVSKSFQVTAVPLAQTITFAQPADTRADQGPVALSATASSGLTVGFASSTLSVCTVSASSVTLLTVGTCTITATQPGDSFYVAATPVARSFQVTAAPQPQMITFAQPADTRLDQGPVSLSAVASSGLPVSLTSSTTSVCTVAGASATLVSTGTCTITATQAGDSTYAAATPVARSFQVTATPLTQTITFAQPGDTAVNQGPLSVTATASSGLTVSFTSNSTSVCTVSVTTVTLVGTGTCSLTAAQTGNGTYAAALPVTRTFAVGAAAQAITFAQPADTRIDQGPIALTASASSGLAVAFASSTTAVCTVSGSSVTLLSTGTCTITASQSGDATFVAATPVARSFQVTAAPQSQTIAFAQPSDTRVDLGPVSLTASASSGLPVSFASSTTSVCTVSASSVTLVSVGTCTITAAQAGDATYAAAVSVQRSFAVTAAPGAQTITFTQPADTRVDQGPVTLDATSSSGLPVSFASSTTSVCTVSGSGVTLVAVGTCTITASQAGDVTHLAAADVTRSFQVTGAPSAQSITFPQPADTRADQGPVSLGATASSGLAVTYASSTTGVCTVSGSSVTLVATGICAIVASQGGNSSYAAAVDVTKSFQVTALPAAPTAQTITFPQPSDTRVDQGPVSLGATASSGLGVSYSSSTTGVCTVSGSSVTLVSTGTCTITASQPGDATHAAAADVSRSFAVTIVSLPIPSPTAQTITFAQPADTQVDQGPVALGATASSGLAVSYSSSTPAVCTVSGSSVTLVATGTCTITAAQVGDATYAAAADVTKSFQVTSAPAPGAPAPTPTAQAITFPQPADTQVDQGPVTLAATASSGLAVAYASSTPSACTVSGSSVTLVATGTCTITVSQGGDGTYAAAADVTKSFAVTSAPPAGAPPAPTPTAQAITFPQPADTRVDRGPVSLGATASSGLGVTYASSTTGVCTVSGSSVTLVSTGTCTITASQPGDATYAAAADVSRSFAVTAVPTAPAPAPAAGPRPQAIVFAPIPAAGVGAGPISLAAAASSGLGVAYETTTPDVCTVSASGAVSVVGTGICTIAARQPGNGQWSPAPESRQSFGVTAPPLPEPTTVRTTTVAGKTTESSVGGIPVGATVALDGAPALPGVASARVVGTHVVVTPTKSFSGVVNVPIVVTQGGRTVETSVPVLVRPAAPTAIAVTPRSNAQTVISWKASASATGYVVRVDGRVVCRTTGKSCDVSALVAPSSHVVVMSTGNAGTRSDDAPAAYAPDKPVLIAIVHFDTDSSLLASTARQILDATESKIAKGGFTHAMLTCHTDSAGSLVYNMALSAARCAAVADYVRKQLGISHVTYKQAAFGFLRPAAPNSTPQGMARNRRVEVYVK